MCTEAALNCFYCWVQNEKKVSLVRVITGDQGAQVVEFSRVSIKIIRGSGGWQFKQNMVAPLNGQSWLLLPFNWTLERLKGN